MNIDKVLGRLRMRIRKLDTEIRDVVRSQTSAGEEGKRELEEAKKGIQVRRRGISCEGHGKKERKKRNREEIRSLTLDLCRNCSQK